MAVAHLTSPGFVGGRSRRESGLRGGGPCRVITDMAVLGFDPGTHSALLLSLHPGVRLEELMENTGFPLHVPKLIPMTPLPTPEELRLLREEIDPKHVYLRR
jgi:glutaconate CoA-transferase, subunit B